MAEVFKKCSHPKSLENIWVGANGRMVCKTCETKYNKSPAGKWRSGKYRKSNKGKISGNIRISKNNEKINNDPNKIKNRRKKNSIDARKYKESREPFSDPHKLMGHTLDAKRVAVLSDIQFPFEDKNALELALQFVEKWKPDAVVLNGDVSDCYSCSDYDRDPFKTDTMLDEMVKCERFMQRLRKIKSVQSDGLIWLGGNHEDRWRRKIWREARSNGGLSPIIEALMHGLGVEDSDPNESFQKAFRIVENGFQYHPYGHFLELAQGNLIVTHGFLVRRHSGYTARGHYERLGKSVIIGHSHRQGSYLVNQLWNPKGAWEGGCLCRLDPEYVQFPDWQQGFVLVTVEEDTFHVEQIQILPGYRLSYGGEVFNL